jgi:transcriptional regulator with XRE-family HTH domain
MEPVTDTHKTQLRENAARNLRALRKKKKLSQEALAERSGLSLSYISEIERGNREPTLETIEKLAAGLGVQPQALLVNP